LCNEPATVPDENGLKSLARDLSSRLSTYARSVTGIETIQQEYKMAVSRSEISFKPVDGGRVIQEIATQLGQLFANKVKALQAAVKHAESLTETFKWDPKISKANVTYISTKHWKNSSHLLDDEGVVYSKDFERQVMFGNSTVHIPVDIYDGDVDILNTVDWTGGMDEVWIQNRASDPELSWQYFGAQTGVLRSYPGTFWPGTLKADPPADVYDVRRRPWYTRVPAHRKT